MALFSKPPAKKPDAPKAEARPSGAARPPGAARPVSAREVAAQAAGRHKAAPPAPGGSEPPGDITVTGASLLDWSSAQPSAIEVGQANPGLCAVLENAALMYASGQAAQARAVLDHGIVNDTDAKLSPLAWLALFDLLQRAHDRAGFDQLALQYVVQFERSAPAWEERDGPGAAPAKPSAAGYVAITGQLTAGVASPLEGLRRAVDKRVAHARVDFSQLTGFDDVGAHALADLLARARKVQLDLSLQRIDTLRASVEAAVKKGRAGGEGAWQLSLELMQWLHEHEAFDDRAVDFAVTFELSPPTWEPPPTVAEPTTAAAVAEAPGTEPDSRGREAHVVWSGVLAGSSIRPLAELNDYALNRDVIAIDMTAVERIDFVCAGAMLNTISRVESQRKSVQISGASPIIRALLLLIGISPRHFVRKAA